MTTRSLQCAWGGWVGEGGREEGRDRSGFLLSYWKLFSVPSGVVGLTQTVFHPDDRENRDRDVVPCRKRRVFTVFVKEGWK